MKKNSYFSAYVWLQIVEQNMSDVKRMDAKMKSYQSRAIFFSSEFHLLYYPFAIPFFSIRFGFRLRIFSLKTEHDRPYFKLID